MLLNLTDPGRGFARTAENFAGKKELFVNFGVRRRSSREGSVFIIGNIDPFHKGSLFDKGENARVNREFGFDVFHRGGGAARVVVAPRGERGKPARRVMISVERQCPLLDVVGAFHSARGFPRRLYCRKEKPDQNSDDGDHHQKLDQGKPRFGLTVHYFNFSVTFRYGK